MESPTEIWLWRFRSKQAIVWLHKRASVGHLQIANLVQFSVPQIEYPLGGSSKKGSHVYFLLQVFWVILLFCQIVLLFDINVVLTSQ